MTFECKGPGSTPISAPIIVASPEDQLCDAMRDAGLTPPDEIYFDGNLRRFRSGTKGGSGHGDKTGWYVCFADGIPAGRFGDWRSGVEMTFRADVGRKLDAAEEIAIQRRIAEARAAREAEEKKRREMASNVVDEIWNSSSAASPDHPYLKRKGIQAHGARITGDGRLIVPLYSEDGELSSLQYITHDGDKKYHQGGATGGKFWTVGRMEEGRLYIAEGFATAATIHEQTGCPVVVSYSASNLVQAAEIFTRLYPGRDVCIVADNDKSGVGMRYAEQASAKYGVKIIMPPIEGDANDYHMAGHDLGALLNPPRGSIVQKLKAVFCDEIQDEYIVPDELIENLITIGSLAVIYGDSNSGKTFFSLSMAAAVSSGTDFFGRKTDPGLVIYLATESPASVITRVQALKRHHDIDLKNLVIVPVPINFYEGDGDANDVIELVKAIEEEKGLPVRLIFGDTLARMSSGANENSGEDMGPVMARFDRVADATGAALVIIHHNGKNAAAGARGWSGIRAHIDTEIEVISENDVRMATVTKQRELPGKGESIYFALHVIEMGVGKFGNISTTCVAVPDDEPVNSKNKTELTKGELANIYTFKSAWEESGKDIAYDDEGHKLPYVSRSALAAHFERNGDSKQVIKNKMNENDQKRFLGILLEGNFVKPLQHGYVIIEPGFCAQMMLSRRG